MTPLSRILSLCIVGLALGFGLARFAGDSRSGAPAADSPPRPPAAPAARPAPVAAPTLAPAETSGSAPDAAPEAAPLLSDEARTRLFAEIEAAYTTYDVASLPKLAPHLRHPNPEVRSFAREAVVQLGHAEGAAVLRAASREARDPREAAALLDAAEFLELPPAPPIAAGAIPSGVGRASAARRGPSPAASAPPY